jgi:hypothetical protein
MKLKIKKERKILLLFKDSRYIENFSSFIELFIYLRY